MKDTKLQSNIRAWWIPSLREANRLLVLLIRLTCSTLTLLMKELKLSLKMNSHLSSPQLLEDMMVFNCKTLIFLIRSLVKFNRRNVFLIQTQVLMKKALALMLLITLTKINLRFQLGTCPMSQALCN